MGCCVCLGMELHSGPERFVKFLLIYGVAVAGRHYTEKATEHDEPPASLVHWGMVGFCQGLSHR